MKLLARDIVLFMYDDDEDTYKAMAAATSATMDINRNLKEISGVGVGDWQTFVSYTKGWTMSGNQFVGDRQFLDMFLATDSTVKVAFAGVNDRDLAVGEDSRGTLFCLMGDAFITDVQIVGQGTRALAQYNISLKGSGALTMGIPGIQFQENTGLNETTSDDLSLFVRNIIL